MHFKCRLEAILGESVNWVGGGGNFRQILALVCVHDHGCSDTKNSFYFNWEHCKKSDKKFDFILNLHVLKRICNCVKVCLVNSDSF